MLFSVLLSLIVSLLIGLLITTSEMASNLLVLAIPAVMSLFVATHLPKAALAVISLSVSVAPLANAWTLTPARA